MRKREEGLWRTTEIQHQQHRNVLGNVYRSIIILIPGSQYYNSSIIIVVLVVDDDRWVRKNDMACLYEKKAQLQIAMYRETYRYIYFVELCPPLDCIVYYREPQKTHSRGL